MRKHGRFFTANIVLGVLLVLAVLFDICLLGSFTAAFQTVREKIETEAGLEPDYGVKSDLTWDMEEKEKDANGAEGWQEGENPADYYQWYSILTVEDASLQELGDSYEGREAEEGCRLYQLTVHMKNSGTMCAAREETELTFSGEPRQEVTEWSQHDILMRNQIYDDSSFYIIPPGKTGTCQTILEIGAGVEYVTIRYENHSDAAQEYQVAVP